MTVLLVFFFILVLGYFTSSGSSVSIMRVITDMQLLFRTLMTQFLTSTVLAEALVTGITGGILTNVTGAA